MADQLYLVRHGTTEWSLTGQHTSRTDLPLTDEGRRQGAALRAPLAGIGFAAVLVSPLRRAQETCELAGLADRAEVREELREWAYGEFEGLTTPQIRADRDPHWVLWRDGCPGGEQPEQVAARADRFLGQLEGLEGPVIAFAHGHILRVLAARWLRREIDLGANLLLSAGSVSRLQLDRGTPVLGLWNSAAGSEAARQRLSLTR